MLPLILPSFLPYRYTVCIGSRYPIVERHSLNHGNNEIYLQKGCSRQTADRLSSFPMSLQKAEVSVRIRIADMSGNLILLQTTDRLIRRPANFWLRPNYRKHTLYFVAWELYPIQLYLPGSYLHQPEDRSRRTSFRLSEYLRKYLLS